MPKIAAAVVLSEVDRNQLGRWVRAQFTPQQVVLRSRILLMAGEGKQDLEIADELERNDGALSSSTRAQLAWKAFSRTGDYDHRIAAYLGHKLRQQQMDAGAYTHALVTAVWPWGSATLKLGNYLATLGPPDVAWTHAKIRLLLSPGDIAYVRILSLDPDGKARGSTRPRRPPEPILTRAGRDITRAQERAAELGRHARPRAA